LRKCPKRLQPHYLERISDIRQHLHDWWLTLPLAGKDYDLPVKQPLSRNNIHLKLCFHLNDKSPKDSTPSSSGSAGEAKKIVSRSTLAASAVTAALEVIHLCQLLQDSVGLSRASYIEFSAARAALLVILAQSFNEHSDRLRNALRSGMLLIRCMATDIDSAKSEVSVIESLELAVKKLDVSGKESNKSENGQSQYGRFKSWAATLGHTTESTRDIDPINSFGAHDLLNDTRFDELGVAIEMDSALDRDLVFQFDDFLESEWQDNAGWLDDIGMNSGVWE